MSLTSPSEPANGRPRGGDSTWTTSPPTRADCPASGSTTGTPRPAATRRRSCSNDVSASVARSQTAPTATVRSTAGSPTV